MSEVKVMKLGFISPKRQSFISLPHLDLANLDRVSLSHRFLLQQDALLAASHTHCAVCSLQLLPVESRSQILVEVSSDFLRNLLQLSTPSLLPALLLGVYSPVSPSLPVIVVSVPPASAVRP